MRKRGTPTNSLLAHWGGIKQRNKTNQIKFKQANTKVDKFKQLNTIYQMSFKY